VAKKTGEVGSLLLLLTGGRLMKLLGTVLVIFLAFTLVHCGGSNNSPSDPDVEGPTITVTSHEMHDWVNGNTPFIARAADDGGISSFEITSIGGANPSIDDGLPQDWILRWGWPTADGFDGQKEITLEAYDMSGNLGVVTHILNVDNTAPTVNWVTPVEGQVIETDVGHITCTGTVLDDGIGIDTLEINRVVASVVDNNFTVDIPIAEGMNNLELVAIDNIGNVMTVGRTVEIITDNVAPSVVWSAPLDGQVIRTDEEYITCSGVVLDAGSGLDTLKVNTVTATVVDNNFTVDIPVDEGFNAMALVAMDNLGNTTVISRTIEIITDVTDPVITFTSHVDGEYDNGPFNIVAVATDARALAEFTIVSPDNLISTTEVSPAMILISIHDFDSRSYPDGPFHITYRATDWVDNVTTRTLTLNLDNTGPTVTWNHPAEGELVYQFGRTLSCTGKVTDDGVGTVALVVVAGKDATLNDNDGWSSSHPNIADGAHTFNLFSIDALGNRTTMQRAFRFKAEPLTP
jgi:hypothetical protein